MNQNDRSRRTEVFRKKVVLKNCAKFTGKHPCRGLFFKKIAGLRPAALLNKRIWNRCFSVNFGKFLSTGFYRALPVAASVMKIFMTLILFFHFHL